MELITGLNGQAEMTVTSADTALAMGSGSLEVLSTPRVAALMERAACLALEGHLEPGQTSVGTYLALEHTAPTPVGAEVWTKAAVTAVNGREIVFEITAADTAGPIATAEHKRVLVWSERFTQKAKARV